MTRLNAQVVCEDIVKNIKNSNLNFCIIHETPFSAFIKIKKSFVQYDENNSDLNSTNLTNIALDCRKDLAKTVVELNQQIDQFKNKVKGSENETFNLRKKLDEKNSQIKALDKEISSKKEESILALQDKEKEKEKNKGNFKENMKKKDLVIERLKITTKERDEKEKEEKSKVKELKKEIYEKSKKLEKSESKISELEELQKNNLS